MRNLNACPKIDLHWNVISVTYGSYIFSNRYILERRDEISIFTIIYVKEEPQWAHRIAFKILSKQALKINKVWLSALNPAGGLYSTIFHNLLA